MILSCPNCATKYTLNEAQLGPKGRTVRCAACKTTWHAERPEKPIDLSFSDARKKETVEDLHEVKPRKLPLKYRAILEDKKRMKALAAQGLVWGGMAVVLVAVLVLGFFLRVDIVRAFPRVAGAYAMVGMKVNGTSLVFGEKTADAAVKGGRFVVTVKAQIRNTSDKPVPVPPVRVKLLDASMQEFDSVLQTPGGLVVGPRETRTLVFDVDDPKNMTATLDLDFDLVAMKKMKKAGPNLRVTPPSEHGESEHGEEDHGTEPVHGEEAPAHEAAPAAEPGAAPAETHGDPAHAEADAHAAPLAQAEPVLRSGLSGDPAGHGVPAHGSGH